VIGKLTVIRNALVRPDNCMAFLSVDLDRMHHVVGGSGAKV
jgi:hypothetical protein